MTSPTIPAQLGGVVALTGSPVASADAGATGEQFAEVVLALANALAEGVDDVEHAPAEAAAMTLGAARMLIAPGQLQTRAVQAAPGVQPAADVQAAPGVQAAADVQAAPGAQASADVQAAPGAQASADVQAVPAFPGTGEWVSATAPPAPQELLQAPASVVPPAAATGAGAFAAVAVPALTSVGNGAEGAAVAVPQAPNAAPTAGLVGDASGSPDGGTARTSHEAVPEHLAQPTVTRAGSLAAAAPGAAAATGAGTATMEQAAPTIDVKGGRDGAPSTGVVTSSAPPALALSLAMGQGQGNPSMQHRASLPNAEATAPAPSALLPDGSFAIAGAPAAGATEGVAAAPPAPGTPAGTAAQLANAVFSMHRRGIDGTRQLTVDITPEELGAVRLTVTIRAGEVHLLLGGSSELSREALRQALPELRKVLEAAGLVAGALDVHPDQPDARPSWAGSFGGSAHDASGFGSRGRSDEGRPAAGRAGSPSEPTGAAAPRPRATDHSFDLHL